jgi:glycosyltransferase involved in cell wall biosynthesis
LLIPKSQQSEAPSFDRTLIVICAYNEELSLGKTLDSFRGLDILVIDDGSTDKTREIAISRKVAIISHEHRLGKAASLADGISYALQNSYDVIVEIGADAVPGKESLRKVLKHFTRADVGGVSCMQVPVGTPNMAYHIDELIWAILAEGKRVQMIRKGTSHLGAVFFAFRPELVDSVVGSVNDDEKVGLSIRQRGYKIIFDDKAMVFFDASTCLGHILERRKRMYYGHMVFDESAAPSMQVSTSVLAVARSIIKSPRRSIWLPPTLLIDFYSRLTAWKDVRKFRDSEKYSRWVTTYAKNSNLVIRNSPLN